jgi:hypothetical protein
MSFQALEKIVDLKRVVDVARRNLWKAENAIERAE